MVTRNVSLLAVLAAATMAVAQQPTYDLIDPQADARTVAVYSAASTTFRFVDGFEILNGQLHRMELVADQFTNAGPV